MSLNEQQKALKQRFLDQRGVWDSDWEALLKLSPSYFESYVDIRDVSQRKQRLSPKVQEFIYIAVAACCTHIHSPGVQAHVKAALAVGATPEEIMEVIGLTYLVGVHTVTRGIPILRELLEERGVKSEHEVLNKNQQQIKADFIKRRGFWPETFMPLLLADADFFESYADFSSKAASGILEPKVRELITCAFDAATTHLYDRGTKIHMRNALDLGATPDEIMEMLEITSLMGIHGVTVSAGLLSEQRAAQQNGASHGINPQPGIL